MADNYVAQGYVQEGYVEGGVGIVPEVGSVPLKFFMSNRDASEELAIVTEVQDIISQNDVALVYIPSAKEFLLVSKTGATKFDGTAVTQTTLTACIKGADGSAVSGSTVIQTSPTTFVVTVPPELVGTNYKIIFGESCEA